MPAYPGCTGKEAIKWLSVTLLGIFVGIMYVVCDVLTVGTMLVTPEQELCQSCCS